MSQAADNTGASSVPQVRRVSAGAPFRWRARGWADLRATRFRGAFYGAVFAAMGLAITAIYQAKWQLTMGLVAGFFRRLEWLGWRITGQIPRENDIGTEAAVALSIRQGILPAGFVPTRQVHGTRNTPSAV